MTTLDEDKGINLEKRWAMSFIMVQYFVRVCTTGTSIHSMVRGYNICTPFSIYGTSVIKNRRGNKICNALARLRPMTRSMGPKHMGKERESE